MKPLKNFLLEFQIQQQKFTQLRSFMIFQFEQSQKMCDIINVNPQNTADIFESFFYKDYQNFQIHIEGIFVDIKQKTQKQIQKIEKHLKEIKSIHMKVKDQYNNLKNQKNLLNQKSLKECYIWLYQNLKNKIKKEKKYQAIVIDTLKQNDLLKVVKTFLDVFIMVFQKKLEKIHIQIYDLFPKLDNQKRAIQNIQVDELLSDSISKETISKIEKSNNPFSDNEKESQSSFQVSHTILSKESDKNQNLLSEESVSIQQEVNQHEMTPKTIYLPSPFKGFNRSISQIKITPLRQDKTKDFRPYRNKTPSMKESNLLNIALPSPTFERVYDKNVCKENIQRNFAQTTQNRRNVKKTFNPLQQRITRNKSEMSCKQSSQFFFKKMGLF